MAGEEYDYLFKGEPSLKITASAAAAPWRFFAASLRSREPERPAMI